MTIESAGKKFREAVAVEQPLQCVGAFNIARAAHELTKGRAAAIHVEDQVQQKRCGHRPHKAVVTEAESV